MNVDEVDAVKRRLLVLPRTMRAWKSHAARWKECQGCGLCKTRKRVVLARGRVPAEVLFIGEAPGESEDALGLPFLGEAGAVFNLLIKDAFAKAGRVPRYAVTNVVSCLPNESDEPGTVILRDPTKEEAASCRERLLEFIGLCKPRLIVTLGGVAKRMTPWGSLGDVQRCHLQHPSFMLRQPGPKASLAEDRFVISLAAALKPCKACGGKGTVRVRNPNYPHGDSCPVLDRVCRHCKGGKS